MLTLCESRPVVVVVVVVVVVFVVFTDRLGINLDAFDYQKTDFHIKDTT